MKRTILALLTMTTATFGFIACSKSQSSDSTSNKAHMQVYLTDDPGDYDAVFIDVQDVRVNYSSDTANGWVSLGNVNAGTYDILRLVNDRDTILGDADLNPGRIEQIRLVLGPNNYVMVGGQRYTLQTPSAQQSGLKLNIHQDVSAGLMYKMTLDFDAGRSIVKTGNGSYILKPVIRTSLEAVGGGLKGFVLPSTVRTSVFAIRGTDTVAGTSTMNGAYAFRGITAGSYNLAFVPTDTAYHKQTKSVTVSNNAVAVVDTVRLN
ncbi:MAG: hypothetical protein JWP27_1492 [Flaviaesturariibacter sp.]|nr:hypothetical protein [Flaviaesturariibacter sp.]